MEFGHYSQLAQIGYKIEGIAQDEMLQINDYFFSSMLKILFPCLVTWKRYLQWHTIVFLTLNKCKISDNDVAPHDWSAPKATLCQRLCEALRDKFVQ